LIEGILLVVLGLGAMIVPPLASLAVTIFLGWMFLISGVAGLALTFWARQMPGFWWSLFSAMQVFQNLGVALKSVGCTANNLVKLTVFLRDMDNLAVYREARNRFFATTPS
jgi:uncharacterized membrane protein HdeD (DUF308 family)